MSVQFTHLTSRVVPLPTNDVDTDQIIPARFLKTTDKEGLADKLFHDWRYRADGTPDPEFPLNRDASRGARILLAGSNFGCGSSREHAPWALMAWGFRAVIATSFADIFKNNGLKNGLLPVAIDTGAHRTLFDCVERDPSTQVTIDLEAQTVTLPDGGTAHFDVDSFARKCLLEGVDQLGYLLSFEKEIESYEQRTNA